MTSQRFKITDSKILNSTWEEGYIGCFGETNMGCMTFIDQRKDQQQILTIFTC